MSYQNNQENTNTTYRLVGMRLTGVDKNYYVAQLQTFTNAIMLKFEGVESVEFGKQDVRGGYSICILDTRGCINYQKVFESKQQLIGYVCGYNAANSNQAYL